MKTKYITLLFVIIYVGLGNLLNAQAPDSLPLDPGIRYGRLPNGFSYYIKPLSGAGKKVSMELMVRAGSKQQAADQYELAHFLEHLPFIATQHFKTISKDNSLLNKLHMQFEDIGGSTGDDHTVYSFNPPFNNSLAFDKGLLFFHDIAGGKISFEKKNIDGERGAIYEEYLYGNGADLYPKFKILEVFSNCLEKALDPVAFKAHIEHFTAAPLKRFYRDWYRPDLMALVVVGHIENVDSLERKIKRQFIDLKMPMVVKPWKDCGKTYLKQPKQFLVMEGTKEAPKGLARSVIFRLFFRDQPERSEELPDFERKQLKQVFVRMLNHRMQNMGEAYNINFTPYITIDFQLPALQLKIKTTQGEEREGVVRTFEVLGSIKKYGFTKKEWKEIKEETLSQLSHKNTNGLAYWSKQLTEHFVRGASLPSDKQKKLISMLKELPLAKFNKRVKSMLSTLPMDIAVTVPKGDKKNTYTEDQVHSWMKRGMQSPKVYREPKTLTHLMTPEEIDRLSLAKIIKQDSLATGERVVTLKNGVRLILKSYNPSPGRYQDKILVHGFSPQGAACLPSKEGYDAMFAPKIVQHSGVGGFNGFELSRFLATTSMPFGIKSYIGAYEAGMEARVAPKDLRKLFQLIYLYFTEPRLDSEAFKDWKATEQRKYARESGSDLVNKNFMDYIKNVFGEKELPVGTKRYLESQQIDLGKAYQCYQKLVGNPGKFTFIISGHYRTEEILALAQKYLGNLPVTEKVQCREVKNNTKPAWLLQGPVKKIFAPSQKLENAYVEIKYRSKLKDNAGMKEEVILDFLANVLRQKVKELRYKNKMAVYLSLASKQVNHHTKNGFLNIHLRCSLADLNKVLQYCDGFVNDLRKGLVQADIFKEVKKSYVLPKWSPAYRKRNKIQEEELYRKYRFGLSAIDDDTIRKQIKSLTREELREAAKHYLKDKYKWEFIAKSKKDK